MSSLVKELQEQALNSQIPITDILRRALVVATKLELPALEEWVNNELNGYTEVEKIPQYRIIMGSIMGNNPVRGWQPIMFDDPSIVEKLSKRHFGQSIGEIENLVKNRTKGSVLAVPFSPQTEAEMMERMNLPMQPAVHFGGSQLLSIVDAVRNEILKWSIKLEKEGIVGEGVTFSPKEKERAASIVYNIGNFTGVLGNVQAETLQIGDFNSISAELKRLGVTQGERNELENILDELKTADEGQKKGLFKRGMEWLSRNSEKIGKWADTIRGWIQILSGNGA